MKKYCSLLTVITVTLCTLSSCMDNSTPTSILFQDVTMGFVMQDLSFHADNGNIYHFGKTDIDHYEAGNRLMINCYANSAVAGSTNEYNATLLSLVLPMCRDGLVKSQITDWEKIGDDPVDVVDGWISGGYLNAKLALKYWDPSHHTHSMDLVFDDTVDNSECLHFEMRHNADGDTPEDEANVYATFKIQDFLPSGKKEMDVELKWNWEDGEHSATFKITL